MNDLIPLLQVLTLVLMAVGAFGIHLFKSGTEEAVKTSAQEAAKVTIKQLKWPGELARELQKTRGVERQELRFKSYGALWKELRPLAIYDDTAINKQLVSDLSKKLSDWYFSECGGLLLTRQARDFYFALQDLLRITSKVPEDWEVVRPEKPEGAERSIFQDVLEKRSADSATEAMAYVKADDLKEWESKAADHAKNWKDGIGAVASAWSELDNSQRFATLQQVASVLRTSLVNDLESRAR
jgi:hypothetical protein